MDSKSATKSRIPTATRKKVSEQISATASPKLNNKEPFNALEMKDNAAKPKTTKIELNVQSKTSSEKQIARKTVEKANLTEKAARTLKNLKPEPQNKNVSPKEIETISKRIANLMQTSKMQELKKSSKIWGKGVNRNSKHADEASSSHMTSVKAETKKKREDAPRPMAVPQRPNVVNSLPGVSKLTRSRTGYELKFGKVGSSSIRPSQKPMPHEKTRKINQDKEVVKICVSPENEALTTLKNNFLPKETSAYSRRLVRSGSMRVPKMPPLERNATKHLNFQLKPLKRSKTIHVFDSVVPVLKLAATISTDDDVLDLEKDKVHGTELENQPSPVLNGNNLKEVEGAVATPKKEIPHGGIPFRMHCAKKVKAGAFNVES